MSSSTQLRGNALPFMRLGQLLLLVTASMIFVTWYLALVNEDDLASELFLIGVLMAVPTAWLVIARQPMNPVGWFIAALFVPLRNKIQDLIDHRFYRKKYDAQKVLQDFGETVRDETDLEKLTGRLVEVVEETMQPASVSVWLREMEHKSR